MFGLDELSSAIEQLQGELRSLRQQLQAGTSPISECPQVSGEADPRERGLPDAVLGGLVTLGGLYIAANAFVADAHPLHLRFAIASAAAVLAIIYAWAAYVGWKEAGGSNLRPGTVATVGIMVVTTGVLQFAGWRDANEIATAERDIRRTVSSGNDVTLDWYKDPAHRPGELDKYFLPVDKGGQRIREIECIAQSLEGQNIKYAEAAHGSELIKQIWLSDDRKSAQVETTEVWFSPKVQVSNGTETPVEQSPEQLNEYYEQQIYVLLKVDGKWTIQSNPVPMATSVSC